MLTKGQKQLLHALLDKYERGSGYVQGKKPVKRIKLNLYNKGKSDFAFYDIERTEIRSQYNEDILNLKRLGIIDFKWMAAEEGHIIAEIWLIYEKLMESYQIVDRVPKGDTVDNVLLLLMEEQEKARSTWLLSYFNDVIELILQKRTIGSLLPVSREETRDFLHALVMADNLSEDEILERVFSIICFGDSKRFEKVIRTRFIGVLKKYLDVFDEDAKDEEILRRVRLVKYPELIEFCGALQIEINEETVNFSPLQYGATLNAKDIRLGNISISNTVNRILFIENKTNFIDYILHCKKQDELVIFHGGCYSPIKGLFFKKLVSASHPNMDFLHWGDIDYGGFSMLARLRKDIISEVKPYRMNVDELINYRKYAIPIGESYIQKLQGLMDCAELKDCVSCLDYMILNCTKLEQEAMIAK